MRKTIVILAALLLLVSCGAEKKDDAPAGAGGKISFEAYIREDEPFTFEFDPEEVVSYEELREQEFRTEVSGSDWRSYFDVAEVYREHYEYDDDGNETSTYMKGSFYTVSLLDRYYYVDNWSRNGLEFQFFIDGEETRVMTNNGKTYDPETSVYLDVKTYSGADPILIFTDFVNSWDDTTREVYTGKLNNYEMVSVKGDLYLLNASAVEFRRYSDDIWYFAAYGAEDEYFVILLQTDDEVIDREKEYEGAVYCTSGYRVNERYTGFDRIVVWQMITELMKQVNS